VGHRAVPHQRGMRSLQLCFCASWKKLRTISRDLSKKFILHIQGCRPRYAHPFCLHAQPRWRMPCTAPSAFINSMLLMLKAHLCIRCGCRSVRHAMHHNQHAPFTHSNTDCMLLSQKKHRHREWVEAWRGYPRVDCSDASICFSILFSFHCAPACAPTPHGAPTLQ
jgi:hypothetical protein